VDEARLAEREAQLRPDDAVNIQFTSGTTGLPKGATLSHRNVLNNGFLVGEMLRYTELDRICAPVPFYHCFGCVMANLAAITHGACVVVPGEAFDPLAVLQAVEAERCTSLYGVPTMFIAELEEPRFSEFDLSSLRTGIMAGAPCPVEVMKRVRADMHMDEVTIAYGMTETSPVSTQTAVDDPVEKRVATVGRVHPHVEVRIVDPATDELVPRGTSGELCTRGYSVMLGYWGDDEATAEAIDAEAWMHTGDLATMDDDGYVNIVGRIKDMIIRGGENIYPREIEEFLLTLDGVTDAYVVGVPSERYGEEVMAWVKLRDGVALSGDELRAACTGRIATYKIPRYWKLVDSFPMTVTGKVQKFRMRELAIEELGLGAAAAITTA
jgi:fatty-acyl-CoA synthase